MLRAIKFDKDGHNPEEPLIVDKNKHKFETFIKILFIHKINLAKNTPYKIDLIFLRTMVEPPYQAPPPKVWHLAVPCTSNRVYQQLFQCKSLRASF